jgi:spore coat polysaccharide biosynthesis protein SpsF
MTRMESMISLDGAVGERVYIRPLTPADVTERYLEWFRDPIVTRFLEARNLRRQEVVDYMESGRASRTNLVYAICVRDTGLHIGNVKIGPISWRNRVSDLVTFIGDTEYWGRGFARDAIQTASRIAFDILNIRKLSVSIHSLNQGSLRAYTAGGFAVETELAEQYLIEGKLVGRVYASQFHPRLTPERLVSEDDRAGSALKTLAIIQARMSSSRLPGKVLRPLSGRPALVRMIERVKRAAQIENVIVATSEHSSDDAIAMLCAEQGIECSRGSLNDVLDRFFRAASASRPEYVVRLTGDCPLIDPEVIDQCVTDCIVRGADYCGNAVQRTYPDGLDVEVMRYSALRQAWIETTEQSDREHVTPFFYHHPERFRQHAVLNDVNLAAYRWTMDEEADYRLIARVFDEVYDRNPAFGWRDILAYFEPVEVTPSAQ